VAKSGERTNRYIPVGEKTIKASLKLKEKPGASFGSTYIYRQVGS
jgi:hypothetical protein